MTLKAAISPVKIFSQLQRAMRERILILDGGMGTMIQRYQLSEADYHPAGYDEHPTPLKGDHDVLSLTRPDVISAIHRAYLEAGADIIETCTFGANVVSQAEYGLASLAEDMCRAAVRIARSAVDAYESVTHKPCFVAGSVGPTGTSLSISSDVDDPWRRTVDFETLAAAYEAQIYAMLDEGVDLLMVETIFDGLNAKAAAYACQRAVRRYFGEADAEHRGLGFPVIFSATLADVKGRLLNGQTFMAFVHAMAPFEPLAIGFNCGFGVDEFTPFIRQLACETHLPICFYPNAGLPNVDGSYSESPEDMAQCLSSLAEEGIFNFIGGCCGTTPEHIRAMAEAVAQKPVRPLKPCLSSRPQFAGLAPLQRKGGDRILVAERTNVTGSKKFKRLVTTEAWDEAVTVARDQMLAGASMLDICMDDGLIDGPRAMQTFLRAIDADPDVSKYPFVIDSSHFDVIRTAMREIPGRCLINSISLKAGEQAFLAQAKEIRAFGHGVVVMAFDEAGQASTTERRVSILTRAVRLLIDTLGFKPTEIAVDPNILAIGTGMPEHDRQALSFIETCRIMRQRFDGLETIGGLSNLSFAFRGRDDVRRAIHTAFLEKAGDALTMVIANPSILSTGNAPDAELAALAEDLVDAVPESLDRMLMWIGSHVPSKTDNETAVMPESEMSPHARVIYAFTHGISRWLEKDVQSLCTSMSPLAVVEGPLMDAMNVVGERFSKAEMFLPEVVRAARMMKQAIAYLSFDTAQAAVQPKRILLATVYGDVHDIGKNIVSVVLSCNGYEVIDLGVMVPTSRIVETALSERVDAVGLSGLITPSLSVMVEVAKAMRDAGLTIPLFVGGAATGDRHTAMKIAPAYAPGVVTHIADASQVPVVLGPWLNPATKDKTVEAIRQRHEEALAGMAQDACVTLEEARKQKPSLTYPVNQPLMDAPRECQVFGWTPEQIRSFLVEASLFRAVRITPPPKEAAEAYHAKTKSDFDALIHAAETLHLLTTHGRYRFVLARPDNETIVCFPDNGAPFRLPGIRALKNDEPHLALADFLAPDRETPVGLFALTCPVDACDVARLARYLGYDEAYTRLLAMALATELVSAACDSLHKDLRERYGRLIRPAFGYPIAPDHSLKVPVLEALNAGQMGITLTPSYMMDPLASICGITIFHAEATLFKV